MKIKLTLLIALSIIMFFIAFFTIIPSVKADVEVLSSSTVSSSVEVIENNITNSNNNITSSVESQTSSITEITNDNILVSTPIETEEQYLEEFKGEFKLTAYCPCYKCSEGYGYSTATGVKAKANHTIAVDPKVIPYGTKVIIEINGERKMYVAEDCGGAIKKKRIDIFFETHSETNKFGVRKGKVYILTDTKE